MLQGAVSRMEQAGSSSDTATQAVLPLLVAFSSMVGTVGPILQQQQALIAASLAASSVAMPQEPVAAEGSLTANCSAQLRPLAELLPPAAESDGSTGVGPSTAAVAGTTAAARSAASPAPSAAAVASGACCNLPASARYLGSVYLAADRYYNGTGGVAAWRDLEQQTEGRWREGTGNRLVSQRRRQLWHQVKQLMGLVEEVAASRGVGELAAARQVDEALAKSQLGVAGASRAENKQRVRELLGLGQEEPVPN